MKTTLLLTLTALAVTTVHAYCDGTPDSTWWRDGDCSESTDPTCYNRCREAGYGCGGCGGWLYGECWCCSNDCAA
ncbi:uncharacterized protein C8A04DRAFT_24887 [Dichotomopilus funicola]|uniref:Uncharacterized protein n=1 Tax=Dichotomopilus funicola TaxID=1934379 RepID=A0AAN6V922_9PEZI|nr:hypothetical protein C8A04DRAFT_24887 [Dichotomopilus funicola]